MSDLHKPERNTDNSFQKGLSHFHQGRYAQALEIFQGRLVRLEQRQDIVGLSQVWAMMGLIYHQQHISVAALNCLYKALSFQYRLADRAGMARALNNIALVYEVQGRCIEALAQYHQALWLQRQLGDEVGLKITLHNLGRIYRLQGRYTTALYLFQQAEGTLVDIIDNLYSANGHFDSPVYKI